MTKSASKRKGGLKSALLSLKSREDERKRAKSGQRAQEMKDQRMRKKISGETSVRRADHAAHRQPIPFVSEWDKTLLIGEGNFSFALSLIQHHSIPGHRITATTYDTEEQLYQKYPEAAKNIQLLRAHNAHVIFQLDARNLGKNKSFRVRAKDLGGFSRIVWNFPHAGAGIDDQDRNIQVNQRLILGFLQSVAGFISPSPLPVEDHNLLEEEEYVADSSRQRKKPVDPRGRVLITLRNSMPYTLWEVPQLAKHPPPGHPIYEQVRSYVFEPTTYPGYEHRRTIGGGQSIMTAGPTAGAGQDESSSYRTWEFALRR